MIGRRGLAATIAFVVGLGAGCERGPREPVRILLIGDSITVGLVSEPRGTPFAELLATELGPSYEVINVGCGGTSSGDWTRSRGAKMCGGRFAAPDLYTAMVGPALPVDLVVVMLGTNDAFGVKESAPIEPAVYGASLRELIDELRADGVRRILLLTPPLGFSRQRAAFLTIDYRDEVAAICDDVGDVTCGPDVLRLLRSDDFAPRNFHPNGAGHRKIATALLESIRGLDGMPR